MKRLSLACVLTLAACGQPGDPGEPGAPGDSCSVSRVESGAVLECEDGTRAEVRDGRDGAPGPVGPAGPQGLAGPDGIAGRGCTTIDTDDGAIIACEDGSQSIIHDGEMGVIGVVDPCGPEREDGLDEILLRMASGDLLASVYDHKRKAARLVAVPPGDYITTDGTLCRFTVSADGSVDYD